MQKQKNFEICFFEFFEQQYQNLFPQGSLGTKFCPPECWDFPKILGKSSQES